jgi:hypothetical protein
MNLLMSKKIAVSLVSVIFMSSVISACSPPDLALDCNFPEVPINSAVDSQVVVVLAPSDKFVDFNSAITASKAVVGELLESTKAEVTFVLADGNPRIIAKRYIDTSGALTNSGRDQQITDLMSVATRINRCVDDPSAVNFSVTDEADFLGAIQKGAASFDQVVTSKLVVVLGNGLQTTGTFSFKAGLPGDSQSVISAIAELEKNSSVAELDGSNVHWVGLGQTRQGDQQPLDENARIQLLDFWKKVIEKSGGLATGVKVGSISEASLLTGGIKTSAIPISAKAICIDPITVSASDGFDFLDDRAEFKNISVAKASAERIAEQINSSSCENGIVVTGYVASGGTKAGCDRSKNFEMPLSLKRAEAFRSLLLQAGVKIEVTPLAGGLGPVIDCENGVGIEEKMAQNRIAMITSR